MALSRPTRPDEACRDHQRVHLQGANANASRQAVEVVKNSENWMIQCQSLCALF